MSNKVLVSGRPGVGKTTLIRKVIATEIPVAGGFLTEEIRQSGARVGFRVKDIHSGEEGVLAHISRKGAPKVGKYGVDVASFDRIGVNALREGLSRKGCIIIDEIGKMELFCDAFRDVVTAVMDSDHPILATIPTHRDPFLDALQKRDDVTIVELTRSNRESLPWRILELLGLSSRGPA